MSEQRDVDLGARLDERQGDTLAVDRCSAGLAHVSADASAGQVDADRELSGKFCFIRCDHHSS